MNQKRKAFTLVEVVILIGVISVIGLVASGLFTPLVQEPPKLQRLSYENERISDMLCSIRQDIDCADALPRTFDKHSAGISLLLIRQPNAVICYRISDGKAFREVFQTDKNSIPPNPDSWELPTAKVHFERWFDDVSSQAYAVQISTAVVYNNHEHSFDKLANSHVFFLNALGGSPEVK